MICRNQQWTVFLRNVYFQDFKKRIAVELSFISIFCTTCRLLYAIFSNIIWLFSYHGSIVYMENSLICNNIFLWEINSQFWSVFSWLDSLHHVLAYLHLRKKKRVVSTWHTLAHTHARAQWAVVTRPSLTPHCM